MNREEWYSQIDYRYLDMDRYVRLRGFWRAGTACLGWHKPLHPALGGYHVCQSDRSGGSDLEQGPSPILIPDPEQLHLELTGLTDYCLYQARIEPCNVGGDPLGESNHVPLMATDLVISPWYP